LTKIFHPYHLWEDFQNGMWRILEKTQEEAFLKNAIEFTGNHKLYGEWMLKVVNSWKFSCEHNLTNTSMNRRAWVGHAAACMAIDCPEYITRRAWWNLSKEQQDLANAQADEAIKIWEKNQNQHA
jgi:hypothetical protein